MTYGSLDYEFTCQKHLWLFRPAKLDFIVLSFPTSDCMVAQEIIRNNFYEPPSFAGDYSTFCRYFSSYYTSSFCQLPKVSLSYSWKKV